MSVPHNLHAIFKRLGWFGFRPGEKLIYERGIVPLYARRSPWWAQWAYAILACNVFMTATAVELTWSRWTEPVKEKDGESETYQLKSVWMRGGLVLAHIAVGSVAAAALLSTRSRYTRTLDVFSHSLGDKRVFIQTGNDGGLNGYCFPLEKCWLRRGRSDDELFMGVEGERGLWQIGLTNCFVHGTRMSTLESSQKLQTAFEGKVVGELKKKPDYESPWKSGVMKGT